jgi:hypothetical protein
MGAVRQRSFEPFDMLESVAEFVFEITPLRIGHRQNRVPKNI